MNFKQFGSLLPDNPLCGIDIYKDTLDLSNGGCTRYVKKYVFTGSENWRKSSSISGIYWTDGIIDDGNNTATGRILGISTHYKAVTSSRSVTGLNNNEIRIYASTSSTVYHEVYLRDERFDAKEAFTDWLAQQYTNGNPVTLWYVLAMPTTETITVPSGLSGTEEGYLNQSGTPTPTNPIYPTANTVEKWFDINHYIMGTDTDTLTTLPAVLYPNDTTATVGLVGNMSQTGTPSPTTPIQPQECGGLETSGTKAGQYKIPILNNSQTTNVYLGEVESTRRIKKLVFDGTEGWNKQSSSIRNLYYTQDKLGSIKDALICTHAPFSTDNTNYTPDESAFITTTDRFAIRIDSITSLSDFTTYLAQQYANGTPVTVWYVLAESTTDILNEPIRKIGDYADEVSGISIPTIAGANTLSVGTTLQPSEVSVNYHGWHPVLAVHERENGQWD